MIGLKGIFAGWVCSFLMTSLSYGNQEFSGVWTYQALNEEDTSFRVSQKEDQITFYREMHPLFEGKRYLLEHLYQGNILGDRIQGKLMVREEGMAEFEFLRKFEGTIENHQKMTMDGMALRRESEASKADKSKQTKNAIEASETTGTPESVPSAKAPLQIPKLIPVSQKQKNSHQVTRVIGLIENGDELNRQKRYQAAIEPYEQALKIDAQKVEVLYKLGLNYGILGSSAARSGDKQVAMAHLKKAIEYWKWASRYDPYNWGAKENIRRAEQKIRKFLD